MDLIILGLMLLVSFLFIERKMEKMFLISAFLSNYFYIKKDIHSRKNVNKALIILERATFPLEDGKKDIFDSTLKWCREELEKIDKEGFSGLEEVSFNKFRSESSKEIRKIEEILGEIEKKQEQLFNMIISS